MATSIDVPLAQGALYASKSNRDSPSTVLYQPYESWAPQSDWSVGLPAGEEAQCVAAGQTFAAVATSRHLLRLFSQAGACVRPASGMHGRAEQCVKGCLGASTHRKACFCAGQQSCVLSVSKVS